MKGGGGRGSLSRKLPNLLFNFHFSGGLELSVVNEIDSTGSILDASDLSFDATCDPTLDESRTRSGRQYKRKSSLGVNKSRY